jgi:hypothetical protein
MVKDVEDIYDYGAVRVLIRTPAKHKYIVRESRLILAEGNATVNRTRNGQRG